jgi:hypothetical protein
MDDGMERTPILSVWIIDKTLNKGLISRLLAGVEWTEE